MAKVLYPKTSDPVETHCSTCHTATPHEVACGQFILGSSGDGGPYWLEYSVLRCRDCQDISIREEIVTA
jgi:hypothetical protein